MASDMAVNNVRKHPVMSAALLAWDRKQQHGRWADVWLFFGPTVHRAAFHHLCDVHSNVRASAGTVYS
jgi:hypothetical protein